MSDYWQRFPLALEIDEIASGSFKRKESWQVESNGFVVDTLEAALWAFHRTSSFEEGCRLAVNLGNDADTTGAVYGQIAGAFSLVALTQSPFRPPTISRPFHGSQSCPVPEMRSDKPVP